MIRSRDGPKKTQGKGGGDLAMELLEDLESLKFIAEEGIHKWLYLKNRSRGLMIKGCAHAIFFCKLIENVRKLLKERQPSRRIWMSRKDNPEDELKVGIIGGGHLGKQLIRALLKLVPVSPDNLRVSSRRPETLEEFRNLGVQCFYRNSSLVQWANVVFLCCLPAQLPHICMEIQTNLRPECIVYSFVTAIPIARLKILLNHSSILRPQYQCTRLLANVWGTNKDVVTALRDPEIIRATCPYSPSGGITLNSKWLEGVLYAVLNLCRTKRMPNLHALVFLNKVFLSSHFEDCDKASCPRLQAVDFVSKAFAKTLTHRKPFPWFDLTAVQLKANPLMQNLTSNAAFQDHLTWRYCDLFGISLAKEQIPARSTDSQSQ